MSLRINQLAKAGDALDQMQTQVSNMKATLTAFSAQLTAYTTKVNNSTILTAADKTTTTGEIAAVKTNIDSVLAAAGWANF